MERDSMYARTRQTMLQWAIDNGVVWDNSLLEVHDFGESGGGRGVRATRDIDKGYMLVQVPEYLLIHADSKFSIDPSFVNFKEILTRLDAKQRICLHLVYERWLDTKSRWAGYQQEIPQSYDTTTMYSDEEIGDLRYQVYIDDAVRLRKEMTTSYEAYRSAIECLEGDQDDLKRVLLDLTSFKWAWGTIQTRTYYFDGAAESTDKNNNACLVPLADLFNHSSLVDTRTEFDRQSLVYRVFTETPFAKGDQVCISYGKHSSATLLHYYGFIIPGNPLDSILIPDVDAMPTSFPSPPASESTKDTQRQLEKKEQILQANGLAKQG
eukprot:gene16925-20132_t